jgi:hypothetical protein
MRDLDRALGDLGLEALAWLHPSPGLRPDPTCRTLALVGPSGRDFWPVFCASPEYCDGKPDALDRWTRRRLTPLAERAGARAVFPFGGPPWHPFVAWALASGMVHCSPVSLMVHPKHGLFLSFRAAFAFDAELPLPATLPSPCLTCRGQPCRSACPVHALTEQGYDTTSCHDWLDTAEGADCLSDGCRVRRACPVGQALQDRERAAFHMAAFHPRGSA